MKPINSKEKSKQLWQFVFVFFGLALIPVALTFFSYYRVPEEISKTEAQKLVSYSNFEHTQKVIMRKMAEIDSNINLYAEASTPNPLMLEKKIVDHISELDEVDTSIKLVQLVKKSYEDHYMHVRRLVQAEQEKKAAILNLQQKEAELEKVKRNSMMPMTGFPPEG